MRAPEIAYRYTVAADVASPTFEILHRSDSDLQTLAGVAVGFIGIPKNRVLVLSNCVLRATPGAGQAVTQLRCTLVTPANDNIVFFRQQTLGVADQIETANWTGELYIFGRGEENYVLLQGDFDAGVNANHLSATINGVVVPRGNAAMF